MEKKMLRKIVGPLKENDVWNIRTKQELMNLCREPDSTSEIMKGRLRCLGHVEKTS
jgi:hypothetical protein